MHLRHLLIPLALVAAAACHSDDLTVNTRPPLGGVRFINAVPDGGPVDIRMIDQVEWSANSTTTVANVGLPFRAGTIHWPTEAKARHIRVFPTDSSIAVTSQILLDTTITIEANKNVTLMLVGSRAAGGKISFVTINDNPPQLNGTQIAVRMVNAGNGASPGASAGYLTATAASALGAVANFPSVVSYGASNYVVRDTGAFSLRTTATGNATILATGTAPIGAPADGLIGATAGYSGPGSAMSAYVFPRSVVGTTAPQTAAFLLPGVVYFVDLIPAPPK